MMHYDVDATATATDAKQCKGIPFYARMNSEVSKTVWVSTISTSTWCDYSIKMKKNIRSIAEEKRHTNCDTDELQWWMADTNVNSVKCEQATFVLLLQPYKRKEYKKKKN